MLVIAAILLLKTCGKANIRKQETKLTKAVERSEQRVMVDSVKMVVIDSIDKAETKERVRFEETSKQERVKRVEQQKQLNDKIINGNTRAVRSFIDSLVTDED